VFDWDGTLADSEAKILSCYQAAITTLGWEPRPRSAVRNLIGLALRETVAALFPACAPTDADRLVNEYRRQWLSPEAPRVDLFPGVEALLSALRSAGQTLVIATGKSRAGLDHELQATRVSSYFAATRCADETRSKPDPTMLLQLLEQTETRPEDALVVGDTTFDLEMARAASVPAVGVTWGMHARETLLAHGPLALVETLDELRTRLIDGDHDPLGSR